MFASRHLPRRTPRTLITSFLVALLLCAVGSLAKQAQGAPLALPEISFPEGNPQTPA